MTSPGCIRCSMFTQRVCNGCGNYVCGNCIEEHKCKICGGCIIEEHRRRICGNCGDSRSKFRIEEVIALRECRGCGQAAMFFRNEEGQWISKCCGDSPQESSES